MPEIEKALAELHALMAYRQRYNDPENAPGIGPSGTYPGRDTPLPEGQGVPEEILAAGLSSRKNLCVHPSVGRERKGKVVDARCRDMTSAWACEKGRAEPGSVELCDFHEVSGWAVAVLGGGTSPEDGAACGVFLLWARLILCLCALQELGKLDQAQLIPPGVWTLEAIKADAKARGVCPYFAIRRMVSRAVRRARQLS